MSLERGPEIPNREHYAYVTRSVIRLFNEGALTNVTGLAVEPDYGYVSRLSYTDGSHRVTYGNDLGLNTGAACDLAKDKGHSKFMLRTIGVSCPKGEEFLLPWWADEIAPSQENKGNSSIKTASQADDYIRDNLSYPVYVKPVNGSKGGGVYKTYDAEELSEVFAEYNEDRVRVAIVEETIKLPDFRLVALDGDLISAYQRVPLAVTGDGSSTIQQLISKLQAQYQAEGRDTLLNPYDQKIIRFLGRNGLTLHNRPNAGSQVKLASISNLSFGGTSKDVTKIVHPRWKNMAAYVAKNFDLRLCGLDLACGDITDPDADYSVLELNAAPGLDHYASTGLEQQRIVDDLYTKVFNTFPH